MFRDTILKNLDCNTAKWIVLQEEGVLIKLNLPENEAEATTTTSAVRKIAGFKKNQTKYSSPKSMPTQLKGDIEEAKQKERNKLYNEHHQGDNDDEDDDNDEENEDNDENNDNDHDKEKEENKKNKKNTRGNISVFFFAFL